MKIPRKVILHEPTYDGWDCDCCGWVTNGEFIAEIDGQRSTFFHDGHFGGGEWDGTDYGMYSLLLVDIFDAHYANIETDEWSQSVGDRPDLSYLHGKDYEQFLELSPNRWVSVSVTDKEQKANISYDTFVLDLTLPDDCYEEPYEHDGEMFHDLDTGKAMKHIFEKTCECLGIAVDYL